MNTFANRWYKFAYYYEFFSNFCLLIRTTPSVRTIRSSLALCCSMWMCFWKFVRLQKNYDKNNFRNLKRNIIFRFTEAFIRLRVDQHTAKFGSYSTLRRHVVYLNGNTDPVAGLGYSKRAQFQASWPNDNNDLFIVESMYFWYFGKDFCTEFI